MVQEEFEDTKGAIRIRKSKQNRQHNGQKKKDKGTNNDLKKHTHKTKNRVKRTPLSSVLNDRHTYYLLNDENTFVTEISEDQKQTCK